MLQISGNFRGLRGFGDAKEDAVTLQLAANRYARDVGKAPLATDGKIGQLTLDMVKAAFGFLVSKFGKDAVNPSMSAAVTSIGALAAAAGGIAANLNQAMDTIKTNGGVIEMENVDMRPPASGGLIDMVSSWFTPDRVPPDPALPPAAVKPMPTQQVYVPVKPAGMSSTMKRNLLIAGGIVTAVGLVALLMPKHAAKPA